MKTFKLLFLIVWAAVIIMLTLYLIANDEKISKRETIYKDFILEKMFNNSIKSCMSNCERKGFEFSKEQSFVGLSKEEGYKCFCENETRPFLFYTEKRKPNWIYNKYNHELREEGNNNWTIYT